MKKLFAVAISNIVYIRSIFPEYAFFDKHLEGIKLKILREDSKCPGATKVINWVRGCFDALDRHYLKTVIIGFYTDSEDPDTVIESYSFKFTYGLDNVTVKLDNKKNDSQLEAVIKNDDAPEKIKNATLSLLRTMILAGNTQDALPEKVIVTMKLLYYDEITPEDYEPNGFKSCDYAGFRHETETINAKLGHVETDFHSFRMILRTDKASFTENYAKASNNKETEDSSEFTTKLLKETPITNTNMRTNMTPSIGNNIIDEEFIVQCPCGGNKDDGIMIMCENCKNWQHSVCFAITEEELVPEIHICDSCADKNYLLVPTDNKLKEINCEDRQELCLIRRAIIYCKSIDILEPGQLSEALGVEMNVARGVFHTLQKEGLLVNSKRKTKNKGLSKIIDKTALETLLTKKFFLNLSNTNLVKNDKCNLKRKRNVDIVNLSNCADNMCLKDNSLNILNGSQDSLFDGQCKKRRRGGIAKTPVIAMRF